MVIQTILSLKIPLLLCILHLIKQEYFVLVHPVEQGVIERQLNIWSSGFLSPPPPVNRGLKSKQYGSREHHCKSYFIFILDTAYFYQDYEGMKEGTEYGVRVTCEKPYCGRKSLKTDHHRYIFRAGYTRRNGHTYRQYNARQYGKVSVTVIINLAVSSSTMWEGRIMYTFISWVMEGAERFYGLMVECIFVF